MTDELERLTAALADRYAIQRELGRGGMATVYLARDLKRERRVAVKVLSGGEGAPARTGSRHRCRAVPQGIEVTAHLQHPLLR